MSVDVGMKRGKDRGREGPMEELASPLNGVIICLHASKYTHKSTKHTHHYTRITHTHMAHPLTSSHTNRWDSPRGCRAHCTSSLPLLPPSTPNLLCPKVAAWLKCDAEVEEGEGLGVGARRKETAPGVRMRARRREMGRSRSGEDADPEILLLLLLLGSSMCQVWSANVRGADWRD